MGDGRAKERMDVVGAGEADRQAELSREVFQQRHADYVPPAGTQQGYDEIAPGMVVPDSAMAPPIRGAGSLARQSGLPEMGTPGSGTYSPDNRQQSSQPNDSTSVNPQGNGPTYESPAGLPSLSPDNNSSAPSTDRPAPPVNPNRPQDNQSNSPSTDSPSPPVNSGGPQDSSGDNNADPNQNGGNGQRPWRAHPFTQPVAPGFDKHPNGIPAQPADGGTTNPDQSKQTADPQQDRQPTAGGDRNNSLAQQVANLDRLAEYSLDPASGLGGNSLIGGTSAYVAGGWGGKSLDYGAKRIVAAGETDPSKAMSLADRLAIFHQKHFGLAENMTLLEPMTHKRVESEANLKSLAENEVKLKVMELRAGVDEKTISSMTDAERQLIADHIYLNSADPAAYNPPKGVTNAPSAELANLRERIHNIYDNLGKLTPGVENHNPTEFARLSQLVADYDERVRKELDATKADGEALIQKYERAGESAFAGNPDGLTAAKKYQFFTERLQGSKKDAADFHLTLTPEEQQALADPSKLKRLAEHLEPTGKPALELYIKTAEQELGEAGLAKYNRYRFIKAAMDDPEANPRQFGADLKGDTAWILERQDLKPKVAKMQAAALDFPEYGKLSNQLKTAQQELRDRLAKSDAAIAPLEAKMDAGRKALESDPVVRQYEYMRNGAHGPIPDGVTLSADQKALVDKIHNIRNRMALLDPHGALKIERDSVIVPRMQAVAVEMEKDPAFQQIIQRVQNRPSIEREENGVRVKEQVSLESVLNPDELKAWEKYKFFKTKGTGATLPDQALLSQAEKDLIARSREVSTTLEQMAKTQPRSASSWLTKFENGNKVSEGHLNNFTKGMATVAIADFAADRLDNYIYGPSHRGVTPYISTLSPWVGLSVPGSWWKKGGVMFGMNIVGSAFEHAWPVDHDSRWNSILRPTGTDSIALGIASTIPLRNDNLRTRLLLMAGGLALSKTSTLASEAIFGTPRSTRDAGFQSLQNDNTERSAASMDRAIDQLKKMDDFTLKGKVTQPMSVLDYYVGKQLSSSPDDPITGDRNAAAYLTAAGEARLSKGTMVPHLEGGSENDFWAWRATKQLGRAVMASFTGPDRQFDYIMTGNNIDLGGQALTFLQAAKSEMDDARQRTKDLLATGKNATINGTKVSEQEIAGLEQESKRVQADMEKIYGKHDVGTIYKQLEEYARQHPKVLGHLRDSLVEKLRNPRSSDQRYLAKLNRDLALIDMAFAGKMVNHNNISRGPFAGSKDGAAGDTLTADAGLRLKKARELDQANEDLPQLEEIAKQVGILATEAVRQQGQSTVNNPLGIQRWR